MGAELQRSERLNEKSKFVIDFTTLNYDKQKHMTANTKTEMKTSPFFKFIQNNSGGLFRGPAVHVFVEAKDMEDACEKTEPHFKLCGDSGRYAEYDDCGCCPCCGHRWDRPWGEEPETVEDIVEQIDDNGLEYMGGTSTALIKADGSIVVGDTAENLRDIRDYISSRNS